MTHAGATTSLIAATAGSASSGGLRERGKSDKRRRIIEAARQVFLEHGYDAATTREIAVRADVSTGTVFVYAKDKRDLLLLIVNDELDAIGDQAAAALARPGTLRERLLGYFRLRYRYWAAEPRLARPALSETYDFAGAAPASASGDEARRFFARRQRMLVQLEALVREAQASGEVVPDVRADLLAGLIVDIYLVEVRRWLSGEAPRLATGMRRLDAVLGLLLRGVLAATAAPAGASVSATAARPS